MAKRRKRKSSTRKRSARRTTRINAKVPFGKFLRATAVRLRRVGRQVLVDIKR